MNENFHTIYEMSAYELARRLDVSRPESLDSPGAKFLTEIQDRFLEYVVQGDDWDHDVSEVVDLATPDYNYQAWLVYIDLGVYQWSEVDCPEGSMTDMMYAQLHSLGAHLWDVLTQYYYRGDQDYKATASESAQFEPDQRVMANGEENIVLSGPHRNHLGLLRYAVQSVEDGALDFVSADEMRAKP